MDMADQHGWRVNTPQNPAQRGGTVSIDMPNAQQVCRRTAEPRHPGRLPSQGAASASRRISTTPTRSYHQAISAVEEILSEMKVSVQ